MEEQDDMVVVHFFFSPKLLLSPPLSVLCCSSTSAKKVVRRNNGGGACLTGGGGTLNTSTISHTLPPPPFFPSSQFRVKTNLGGRPNEETGGSVLQGKSQQLLLLPHTTHRDIFLPSNGGRGREIKKLGESSIVLLPVFGQGGEKNRRHLPSSHILLPLLKLSGEAKIPTLPLSPSFHFSPSVAFWPFLPFVQYSNNSTTLSFSHAHGKVRLVLTVTEDKARTPFLSHPTRDRGGGGSGKKSASDLLLAVAHVM